MNRNNQDIAELREELDRLRIAADNIERIINDAQEETITVQANRDRRPRGYRHTHPVVHDTEGVEILIGDQVQFVTRGSLHQREVSYIKYRTVAAELLQEITYADLSQEHHII